MFGFLKKLFGSDAETNKAAGVQVEQAPVEAANQAPYKVEMVPVSDATSVVMIVPEAVPATTPIPLVVEGAGVVEVPAAKPAKKKPRAAKPKAEKPAAKPAAITAPKKGGRKPKSKA